MKVKLLKCSHKDYESGRKRGCYHCTQWANTMDGYRYAQSLEKPKREKRK